LLTITTRNENVCYTFLPFGHELYEIGRIGRLYFPFTFLFKTIKGLDKKRALKPAVNIGLFMDEGIFKWKISEPPDRH